jgi:serine/threonine protein kinase
MRGAWNIATSDVVVGAVLASGTFGVVHDGSFAGLRVAIKVLKYPLDEELYPDVGKDFARECETLMAIRHASLLIFYGAGLTVENKPFMVTEFMSRGSLKTMLLDHQQPFEWTVRAKCALQIARAMEYLHSIEIVHRDLKSDNCLVNGTMDTKVRRSACGCELVRAVVMCWA